MAGAAPVQDEQSRARRMTGQFQEILPIAGDEDCICPASVIPHVDIVRLETQHFSHPDGVVPVQLEDTIQVGRNILVDQERHESKSVVCSAISGSSSA